MFLPGQPWVSKGAGPCHLGDLAASPYVCPEGFEKLPLAAAPNILTGVGKSHLAWLLSLPSILDLFFLPWFGSLGRVCDQSFGSGGTSCS